MVDKVHKLGHSERDLRLHGMTSETLSPACNLFFVEKEVEPEGGCHAPKPRSRSHLRVVK